MIDQNDEATKLRSTMLGNATLSTLVSGQVYFMQAPQNQGYPYITFFPISGAPIHTQGTADLTNRLWQVDIWSTSALDTNSIMTQVSESLDSATLSLATLTEIKLLRNLDLALEIEMVEEAGKVFHQPMQYQLYSR